jgi:hypothetical protein
LKTGTKKYNAFSIGPSFSTLLIIAAIAFGLFACNSKRKIPDVSGVQVNVKVDRFEKDFFSIDTNKVEASLNALQTTYGAFLNDYLYNILAIPPFPDSVIHKVKLFIHDYKPIYDSVQQRFTTFKEGDEIKRGLQFIKYYFPKYNPPANIITFVGPLEGYGNVLTGSGIAVGLQLYLGKDFSIYHTEYINNVYPEYRSRRFEAAYVAANSIRNVIDDMFPYNATGKPLIDQMIEQGKRLYLLDQFLPETADSVKTGYTQQQLDACYKNEAFIWSFFLQNNLLYQNDPFQIRDYVNDGPKTPALSEASPGNIGQFVGWQIVKTWIDKNKEATLETMMRTPARQLFEEAKYKPRNP